MHHSITRAHHAGNSRPWPHINLAMPTHCLLLLPFQECVFEITALLSKCCGSHGHKYKHNCLNHNVFMGVCWNFHFFLRKVSVSMDGSGSPSNTIQLSSMQGCSLGLETVSRRSFQTSRSRLGLVETWEGLGLDLVSD